MGSDETEYASPTGWVDSTTGNGADGPEDETTVPDPYARLVEAMLRCTELAALRPSGLVEDLESDGATFASPEVTTVVRVASEIAWRCLGKRHGAANTELRGMAVATATWWVAVVVGAVTDRVVPVATTIDGGLDVGLAEAVAEALEAITSSSGSHPRNGMD